MKWLGANVCMLLFVAVHTAFGLGDRYPQLPPPAPHSDNPVDNLYLKGNKAQQDKDYKLAIACWDEVLKISPKDEGAYVNRAAAYAAKGDTEKAFADYVQALQIDPNDIAAYLGRAQLYEDVRLAALKKGAMDDVSDTENAIADYTSAVKIMMSADDTQPAKWWQEKAHEAELKGNYCYAVARWKGVLPLDPKNAHAWYRIAVLHYLLLEPDKALSDCDEALKIDPQNEEATQFRALIPKLQEAAADNYMADFSEKIRIAPDPLAFTIRAQNYRNIGENDKAETGFLMVLCLESYDNNSERNGAAQFLTSIYGQRREWDKAMAMCNLAAKIGHSWEGGHGRRAYVYSGMKDYAKAAEEAHKEVEEQRKEVKLQKDQQAEQKEAEAEDAAQERQAEAEMANAAHEPPPKFEPTPVPDKKDEENEYLYVGLCQALIACGEADYRAGQYAKARTDFDEAMKLDPKDTWSRNAKAWFLATCPDAKFRNGAEAVKLAKIHGDFDTMAAAYAEAGKWDEAVKQMKSAIEADKEDIVKATQRKEQGTKALADAKDPSAIREAKKKIYYATKAIKDNEEEIEIYSAQLNGYEQKKPCRDQKELGVGD